MYGKQRVCHDKPQNAVLAWQEIPATFKKSTWFHFLQNEIQVLFLVSLCSIFKELKLYYFFKKRRTYTRFEKRALC